MILFGLFSRFAKDKNKKLVLDVSQIALTESYLAGFNAGFEQAMKLMPENSEKIRKHIETQAINDTLKRLNGN